MLVVANSPMKDEAVVEIWSENEKILLYNS